MIAAERLVAVHAREVRRELARRSLAWFVAHYGRDDSREEPTPLVFKPFHVHVCEVCQDEQPGAERALIWMPADFGKTTIVAKWYAIWLACRDPNVRVLLMGKNMDDAKKRLRAIKAELEGNERLLDDFGPLVGAKWTETEVEVARRTIRAKEATITCFGSETNVFGGRYTHAILDDIVTIENSGSQVRDDTRARLRENFWQGVMKVGSPGLVVRWINTPVDLRDLQHEVAAPLPPDGVAEWRSDKGFRCIHYKALDDETGESLWPERYPAAVLIAEREADLFGFLKRRQCRCLDAATRSFQPEWFVGDLDRGLPGCLDRFRRMGECPAGLTRTAGYDPTPGLTQTSKWCAWVEVAFDRRAPEPREYIVTDIRRFRAEIGEQASLVVATMREHGVAAVSIEANGAQQWLLQLDSIKNAVRSGLQIGPHYTHKQNKPDPDVGIPSIGGLAKAGLLRLPYGDPESRLRSDVLIGEMVNYPQSPTIDVLMALWFAILKARELAKQSGLRVFGRPLPAWVTSRGLTPERAARLYGR